MFDGKAFGEEMVGVVKAAIDRATRPLEAELKALRDEVAELRAREPVKGLDGAPGRDGTDGKDIDMQAVEARIDAFLKTIPVPENGKDGRDGIDGKDGIDGAPGEKGEDGVPGKDGIDGKDGAPGRDGEKGIDGKDGIGLAGAFKDANGDLVVTLSNGEVKHIGPVNGRDGADGKDGAPGASGKDGFSLDDFDASVMEDGRTLELSFTRGDTREVYELSFPITIYRGVFVDGKSYERGDEVTWAGSTWHCNAETSDKPGEGSKSWTLKVKRGRDGKDFKGSEPKAIGPVKI